MSKQKEKPIESGSGLSAVRESGHSMVVGECSAAWPEFLRTRRWFGGKAREIESVISFGSVPVELRTGAAEIIFLDVRYADGADYYVLPIASAFGEGAVAVREKWSSMIVGPLADAKHPEEAGVLYEALAERDFLDALLEVIASARQITGTRASVSGEHTRAFESLRGPEDSVLEPSLSNAEQSNSSIRYGDRLILKLFRRLQQGLNPEVEIGSFLTNRTAFRNFAPVAGTLAYRLENGEAGSLGVLQAFVPNQGDAWKYTLGELHLYFDRVKASGSAPAVEPSRLPPGVACESVPEPIRSLIGGFLDSARLLGRRTAELHLALASDSSDPDFRPEPLDRAAMQARNQSLDRQVREQLRLLDGSLDRLDAATRKLAERVLQSEAEIQLRLKSILGLKSTPVGTRIHGDYHLGQVLYTGADFVIIDFEGEPARPLEERRIKRSPLQDVAGMMRSFQYAAYMGLLEAERSGLGAQAALEPWARLWSLWVSNSFLASYFALAGSPFVSPQELLSQPSDPAEVEVLLDVHLLEKATYELGYELNNRPDWVRIPLRGILDLLEPAA